MRNTLRHGKVTLLLAVFCLLGSYCLAQPNQNCAIHGVMGQTPQTAFPVCGSSVFHQDSVPICYNNTIPTSCPANGNVYQDLNPFWYKFTCFASGSLGFMISPNNAGDDYDWEIFDITGAQPQDVYSNASLVLCYNWSGVYGNTGTSASAPGPDECGSTSSGPGGPTSPTPFSSMPSLIKGHQYLLMISHFLGNQQSGYSLSFTGGTAVITDTTQPRLAGAIPGNCGSTSIKIGLNKTMQCSSLAADGSDFRLSTVGAGPGPFPAITGASGDYCSTGFDMDSVTLVFSGPLPAGNYFVVARQGTDLNTLLDICGTQVPVGDSVPVSIPTPPPPAPFDSIIPVGCAPNTLTVVFSKDIQCSSVAPDGSDFRLTTPSGVTITGAACGASPNLVQIQLSGPLVVGGNNQLQLAQGSDGNTIIDTCNQQLPAGQVIQFATGDTLSAQILYQVHLGCKVDTIDYSNAGGKGINTWNWIFDGTRGMSGQNEDISYNVFGTKTAILYVTNGFCSDSASVSITLNNTLKAVFEATNLLCPNDKASFADSSIGTIISYNWLFGDGTGSNLAIPGPKQYPDLPEDKNYLVQLIVSNGPGCFDTASQIIKAVANCYIAVPSAFTPNGDGINDYLYPLNAYKAANLEFNVYNRYGQLVFHTTDWTVRWDGTINGNPQPVGAYVWTLRYTNIETGEKVFQKGTSMLIR